MRRRPGIAGLQLDAAARSHYRALGESVQETKAEHVQATLHSFKSKLEEFALKHARDIKADPGFRSRFHAMCATVGVDPLASSKGAWAKLLGIGDWYAALGVAVVEACLASRSVDGGLTDAGRVRSYVIKKGYSSSESSELTITDDDVERAVQALSALGSGFSVVKVGERRLVRSVPLELSDDGRVVLEFANSDGWTTARRISEGLGWDPERASAALERLLADGIGLADDQFVEEGKGRERGEKEETKRAFWFPCLGK